MRWREVVAENPWLTPALGAAAVAILLFTAGPVWAFFEVYVLVFVSLIAFDRSRRRRLHQKDSEMAASSENIEQEFNHSLGRPWDAQLDAGQELSFESAAGPDELEPSNLIDLGGVRAKQDAYPVLDAFVAATRADTAGVREALESWVKQAPNQDREKEREAQLHYWLYRAGDATELERLRELAAANPDLVEVTVFLHLALQEYGELWS
jgi:hypothetical protein